MAPARPGDQSWIAAKAAGKGDVLGVARIAAIQAGAFHISTAGQTYFNSMAFEDVVTLFLRVYTRGEVLADLGLTDQDVARRITGWVAAMSREIGESTVNPATQQVD